MQTYNYKVTLLISIGKKRGYFTHNQYFIINTLKTTLFRIKACNNTVLDIFCLILSVKILTKILMFTE